MMKEKRKILVVDDEFEVTSLVKKRLEREGYNILTAANGKEGFIAAQQEKPNLILLDIMMPECDGIRMLRSLKMDEVTIDIPVLMLTAKSDTVTISEVQRYGAADYFIKPFDWDNLLRYIKKQLALQE